MQNPSKIIKEYLSNFDSMLKFIFGVQSLDKQPRYIVMININDGIIMRYIHDYIFYQTIRGKRLDSYPISFFAIVSSEKTKLLLKKELSDLPYECAVIKNTKNSSLVSAFDTFKIEGTDFGLLIEGFSTNNNTGFENYKTINKNFGIVKWKNSEIKPKARMVIQQTAEELILDGAKYGWFPHKEYGYHYPKPGDITGSSLIYFEKTPFLIRLASLTDVPKMIELEMATWPKQFQIGKALLEGLITAYPRGQLVLEYQGNIIALACSQRIHSLENLKGFDNEKLPTMYDPDGAIIFLLNVTISHKYQTINLEGRFLEFFLQKAFATDRVMEVVAGVRCQNYPGKDVVSMEYYAEELKIEKGYADLGTRIHANHGGEIIACFDKFCKKDEKFLGYDFLIRYTHETRSVKLKDDLAQTFFHLREELNPQIIENFVDQIFRGVMSQSSDEIRMKHQYNRSKTFSELGLSFVQLLDIRTLLEEVFKENLESNFFLENKNPDAVIKHFIATKLQFHQEWLYEAEWQATVLPKTFVLTESKLWIIFVDEDEKIGSPVKELLHAHKQKCIIVEKKERAFRKISKDRYSIDPYSPEDYKNLFKEISPRNALEGVIYLWGRIKLSDTIAEPTQEELNAHHHFALESLALLANQLALIPGGISPKLWVITDSISTDGSVTTLFEWPLNSLCKIIREEYPKLHCRFISIDPSVSVAEAVDDLFNELFSDTEEPQVAFRKNQRLVCRLVNTEEKTLYIPKFSQRASYLVVGGFRYLGMQVANWYASHGARTIILLDEIEISPEIKSQIKELEKQNVELITFNVKLDDRRLLEKVFKEIEAKHPILKGLVHAVGIVDNELLYNINWQHFHNVHRLKISLPWHLHHLTKHLPLDHFVLFSSCYSDLSPLGKANHATGNSFLDALSYYRCKRGLPCCSVSWGPWESKHMKVQHVIESTNLHGVKVFRVKSALRILEQIFSLHKTQIFVLNVDWPLFLHNMVDVNLFFEKIAIEMAIRSNDILKKFKGAQPDEVLRELESVKPNSVLKSALACIGMTEEGFYVEMLKECEVSITIENLSEDLLKKLKIFIIKSNGNKEQKTSLIILKKQ